MKKIVTSILGASLLAGALYASGDHMGNHMHEGKMMNHGNPNGMTNMNMSEMKKMHKECLALMSNTTTKVQKNMSSIQQKHLDIFTSDKTDIYSG